MLQCNSSRPSRRKYIRFTHIIIATKTFLKEEGTVEKNSSDILPNKITHVA
jgi:hypothetical protein